MASSELTTIGCNTDDTYTLRQLLGGDLSMVIPDMQRDYCWGSGRAMAGAKSKAPIFVSGLVHLYLHGRLTPLGLLFGYEYPRGSRHLHIIDGQQRLTTLYLLVGMLFRRKPTDTLRRLLISDYELLDDHEPRLLYQMRNEAMYFISDLVTNFFLDRNGRLSQLEASPWYHNVYDSDPTVQCMIGALREIDQVLEQAASIPGWDFGDFANFVTDKLTFLYHDLGERVDAEHTFITINTTIEPLSVAQNFKASLFAVDSDIASILTRWEEMEEWAWLHRDRSYKEHPSTSDPTLDRLLKIWVANTEESIYDALLPSRFDGIYRFFKAYRRLVACIPDAMHRGADDAQDIYLLVPTIRYIKRWHFDDDASPTSTEYIRRFWDFLSNITRYQKVSQSGIDKAGAITIVNKLTSPDLISLLDNPHGLPERLFNAEERAKLQYLANAVDAKRAYQIMLRAQSHPLINGRPSRVINWCTDGHGVTDLNSLSRYVDRIYEIWGNEISQRADLDPLRVALLTLRSTEYPMRRRGDNCLSLCWQDYDWQRLMANAPSFIRQFIDRVYSYHIPLADAMRQMTERFNDRSYPYFFLIKDSAALSRCMRRTLLRPGEPFIGTYLHTADGAVKMQWYVEQQRVKYDRTAWRTMRPYGAKCLYTDHRSYNLAIDLYHTPREKNPYRIEVFSRKDASPTRPKPANIAALVRSIGYPVRYDAKRGRHCTHLPDAASALTFIRKLTGLDLNIF